MVAMAQPWKHPDSGILYFRREVPEDLRGLIGKREWKVSLRTRNPAEARPRFAAESLKCEESCAAAREQLLGRTRLVASDAPKLADRWSASVLAGWETESSSIREFLVFDADDGISPACTEIDADDHDGVFRIVGRYLKSALGEAGLPMPDRFDPVWGVLLQEFYRAWWQLCLFAAKREGGDWRSTPDLPAVSTPLACETQVRSSFDRPPVLSVVYGQWADDKRQTDGDTRSTRKTIAEFGAAVARFVELFGDIEVSRISRGVCHEFRTALGKLPTKGEGTRAMKAPDLIAKAEAEGLPVASLATVKKQLRALSAVLGFAQRLGHIHENPITAAGITQRIAKAARKQAVTVSDKGYSRAALQQIFASPLFRGQWRPKRADYGEALYWMPLIMAYSGARREELAQLLADDVQEEGGVWCLVVKRSLEAEQTTKSDSSSRQIPLHPDLLELGFLAYKDSVPQKGRLFPALIAHASNGFGHAVGRAWTKYLHDVVALESAAAPAHGFRHSFKTLCREVGIPKEVHDWITGHTTGHVGDAYGVNPVGRMAEELKKFPSIARMAGLLPT